MINDLLKTKLVLLVTCFYIYKLIQPLYLFWNSCFYLFLYNFICQMQINYTKHMPRYMRKVHLTLSASKIIHIFCLLCNGIHGKYSENICARVKIEFLCYIVRCDTKSVEALEFLTFPLTYSHAL